MKSKDDIMLRSWKCTTIILMYTDWKSFLSSAPLNVDLTVMTSEIKYAMKISVSLNAFATGLGHLEH